MADKSVVEIPKAGLPAVLDFAEDAGAGFQNLSAQDVSIPFIGIIQQLSPQLKRETKVEGAEEGCIFNPVTQEVIDGEEGIVVIPCAYQKKWVEWKQRSVGGGFVKHHETDALLATCVQDDKMNEILPNGNVLVPTAYYYILLKTDSGNWTKAILSWTKTQLKKSKKWNTIMSSIKFPKTNGEVYTPAIFSHSYRLKTARETKNSYSWFGWEVAMEGVLTDKAIYNLAKALHQEVEKGEIKLKPVEEVNAEQVQMFPEGM